MKNSRRVVIVFSSEREVNEFSKAEEYQGKLQMQMQDDKLMHAVLQDDKKTIDDGKIIEDGINRGMNAFIPDMMFENLVKNFSIAKQLYGEKLLRLVSGYDSEYIEKNLRIPEFQKKLQKEIEERIENLKTKKLLEKDGTISDKGVELASLSLYIEEIDNLTAKGAIGEKIHKKSSHYGEKGEIRLFKKGDRYKDIALRKSIKTAIKRGHEKIKKQDLQTFERQSKGAVYIIYGLDSSASMKGEKIHSCKKAGVALSYKAISDKDKVGLVVFGTEIKDSIEPTDDFGFLLNRIARIRAGKQTDFKKMIEHASEMFPAHEVTKHLLILTDALPTVGKEPEEETLSAVSNAKAKGITISLIGIKLDSKGEKLAKKITKLGNGKLYMARDLGEVDRIVLEDYYGIR
ncbi:VWA domain-containing protein [Candidatus Woesearchaeota archaeon]|nr:VWA domain-containing protein [Candidatus Woesearchaeota archaeon]